MNTDIDYNDPDYIAAMELDAGISQMEYDRYLAQEALCAELKRSGRHGECTMCANTFHCSNDDLPF